MGYDNNHKIRRYYSNRKVETGLEKSDWAKSLDDYSSDAFRRIFWDFAAGELPKGVGPGESKIQELKCVCELNVVLGQGCKCGAFKAEMELKVRSKV